MALRLELSRHLADFDGVSVLVTHDALDAMTVANRVLVIDDGRVAQDGTPAEVAQQPATDHVARLVGLNVLRGTSSGTSIRLADGTTLVSTTPARGDVSACFSPSAVTLTVGEPHGSARNRWPGRVTSVAPHGSAVRVHVDAAAGLIADVTPASAAQLGVVPGAEVWATVKATEVSVYGASEPRVSACPRRCPRIRACLTPTRCRPACPPPHEAPDRNLALELVRVTEAAAMAAGRWVGRGDKNGADGVAVNAMRTLISTVGMRGVVVIGEGEKDNAPMLFNGEEVGDGTGPECDVAVDPIDGTTLAAKGMANAIAVMAVAPRGSMYDPSAVFYMEKLVTGPEAADVVDIRYPVAENIHQVAKAKGSAPEDVTVVLLDRPRHADLVDEIRATGARIKFITDGDVAGAIMAARAGTGIDLLLGVGGTPEGIITACAMKCLDGVIQGRLWPKDDEERQRALDAGHDLDPDHVLTTDDLVTGDDVFFVATGITDGELMQGVRYRAGGASTHSLVMRSRSGTIRSITSDHKLQKLKAYAAVDFGH